jgi:hypothetical protein
MKAFCFAVLLATSACALKLVPADEFMGIVPKSYAWPSETQCAKPVEFPYKDAKTRILSTACFVVAAEHGMHRAAGALARNADDRSVFSAEDVESECEHFHRASRAGAVFITNLMEEEQLITMCQTWFSVIALAEALEIPDVSEWCDPDPFGTR